MAVFATVSRLFCQNHLYSTANTKLLVLLVMMLLADVYKEHLQATTIIIVAAYSSCLVKLVDLTMVIEK